MKVVIITEDAPLPVGPYSQAIKANGFIFVSGQIPLRHLTGEIVEGSIEEQTRQVLRNLEAILVAGDSSLAKVVKISVFLKDINDFATVNSVFQEFFKQEAPARETMEVSNLPKGAKVEISAIAIVDS
ncbi:MAG: RidA family protein [Actinomycetota bacterium]|nr:RidA family protein [Actinomycetota bacterium]MDI6822575.1 RidA family protein [Actinomycetota bacterium]